VATSSDVESSGNDAGEATPSDLEYSRTALETINIGRSPGQRESVRRVSVCFRRNLRRSVTVTVQ
jgi:hypothetical protein